MDLMDKFLFYEKMSEIDRILNRLPSKERGEFENEWQSMLYSLKRKIWKQRLKKIVISTLIYPVLVWFSYYFKILPRMTLLTLGTVFLFFLVMILSIFSENEYDVMILAKRQLAVSIYQRCFERKR